nr:RNA-directed DNA polymerase, eukaryota [Tanacetum cinerariifolium]
MSKLDRFLVSEGIFSIFPSITALCLDRHLSDHRLILLREVYSDFGLIPFRFYHSWFSLEGFDAMVEQTWRSFSHSDVNRMIRFKKKLQNLKAIIRCWVKDKRMHTSGEKNSIKNELSDIDKEVDREVVSDTNLFRRLELQRKLHDINQMKAKDSFQKSKIKWAIEGDENSKFFHGTINKKRSQLAFVEFLIMAFGALIRARLKRLSLITLRLSSRNMLLIGVLEAFGFGQTWCKWIRGTFSSARALVLVNGSLSNEFSFHCGLKQDDPLSPYLFILIMESLHMSFSRAVDQGLFKGVHLQGSISISHLFYADDAMFIGEWSDANLKGIVNILQCFFLASGLKINIQKSQVLGVGISRSIVMQAASSIGCGVMHNKFSYLGVMVGECISRHQAWDDTVLKLKSCLSNWKVKTLSIGGRLTLLKSVLGASPLYNMSIFKVPKGILKSMEAIRINFFNGIDSTVKKITWAAWDKILASKKNDGLGVSSFHALNRALLLKWVCRFISQDGDGEFRVKEMQVSPNQYSPDMSMMGVGLAGSYVLFGLAELVFFYSSSV